VPFQTLTTVTTAATSQDLTTLALVKAELGVTDTASDTLLAAWITRASAAIAQYCNRIFAAETLRDDVLPERDPYPWQVPGTFAPLQLSRRPVLASPVVTVSVMGEALDAATDFLVDRAAGQIVRLDAAGRPRAWTPDPTSVVYRAGYDQIPADVQDACIRLVRAQWWLRKRGDPMKRAEDIPGVRKIEWWVDTSPEANGAMPRDVVDLLETYRVPVIA